MNSFFKFFKKKDIVIYDTIYPNPISGFRLEEFTAYLEYYDNSCLYVNPTDYIVINQNIDKHEIDLNEFKSKNKTIDYKIQTIKKLSFPKSKLFYCVFLNNIYKCLPHIHKNKINFLFTLYPGGGFDIKNEDSKRKIKEVISSEFFKGVIVTQNFTKQFLIEEMKCQPEKIFFIFGGIVPQYSISSNRERKIESKSETINICFAAAKYMKGGQDKGFDIFIDTALELIRKNYNVHFHVIGGFNESDVDLKNTEDKFTFHGYKDYSSLKNIFLEQDIILSPNRPFVLNEGAFDGFPLGTVVEAALNGVVPIVTDELNQNSVFNKEEIIIAKPTTESFVNEVEILINDLNKLHLLSKKTQQKFREVYLNNHQLTQRINIINRFINDTRN